MKRDMFEVHQYVFILNSNNEILWLKSNQNGLFVLPGGTLEYGENTLASLEREVMEETNIKVKNATPLEAFVYANPTPPHYCVYYVATFASGKVKISHEHQGFAWRTWDKIKKNDVPSPEFIRVAKKAIRWKQLLI